MSSKVTSLEVARRAGVSQSAVSRFFTKGASVSRKTADKVHKAASELGYRPNILARAMASGRSRIIGLIVAYLDNDFYSEALERLSNALQTRGYHVLVVMASQAAGNIDKVVDEMLDYQVDGVVAASLAMSSDLAQKCHDAGISMVMFNRSQAGSDYSAVTTDNFSGGRRVAEFLLAGEHQRIGYISGWEGASTQRDREKGFRTGLAAAGRKLDDLEIGNFTQDGARMAASRMFSGSDQPDAVFVANDHMAFAVMDELRTRLGLKVPDDVSVVGFDDVGPASWPSYDLTTVRQRTNLMVESTVEILIEQIESPEIPCRKVTIDAELVLRSSARVPEGWKH